MIITINIVIIIIILHESSKSISFVQWTRFPRQRIPWPVGSITADSTLVLFASPSRTQHNTHCIARKCRRRRHSVEWIYFIFPPSKTTTIVVYATTAINLCIIYLCVWVYMSVLCTIIAVVVARKCFPSCLFAKKHHQQRTRVAIEEKKERGSDEKKKNNKNKKAYGKHVAYTLRFTL